MSEKAANVQRIFFRKPGELLIKTALNITRKSGCFKENRKKLGLGQDPGSRLLHCTALWVHQIIFFVSWCYKVEFCLGVFLKTTFWRSISASGMQVLFIWEAFVFGRSFLNIWYPRWTQRPLYDRSLFASGSERSRWQVNSNWPWTTGWCGHICFHVQHRENEKHQIALSPNDSWDRLQPPNNPELDSIQFNSVYLYSAKLQQLSYQGT